MSPPQKKPGGRFGYISTASQDAPANGPQEEDEADAAPDGVAVTDSDDGAGGRSRPRQKRDSSHRKAAAAAEFESVPKGEGRMKQPRSQLNVRLPTPLKRQATAKAVLEGRDIGEVVEELLKEYLNR